MDDTLVYALKNMGIYDLRNFARSVGVAKPTTLKRQELIAAIKSAIELIKKEDIYASWSEWEIYMIKIADTKGGTRDLLVAKKRFDNQMKD